jgi:transcriptional regulator
MYVPALFREGDGAVLRALMERYPFATLITRDGDAVSANHLPLLVAAGAHLLAGMLKACALIAP